MKRALLFVMAAFYMGGGSLHLIRPDFYLPMMPSYLPAHELLVFVSGLAEIALGVSLLIPKLRKVAAWAVIALLIAVFPANVNVAMHNTAIFGATEGAGWFNWVRLPIQALLIAWAWWYTRPAPSPQPLTSS